MRTKGKGSKERSRWWSTIRNKKNLKIKFGRERLGSIADKVGHSPIAAAPTTDNHSYRLCSICPSHNIMAFIPTMEDWAEDHNSHVPISNSIFLNFWNKLIGLAGFNPKWAMFGQTLKSSRQKERSPSKLTYLGLEIAEGTWLASSQVSILLLILYGYSARPLHKRWYITLKLNPLCPQFLLATPRKTNHVWA